MKRVLIGIMLAVFTNTVLATPSATAESPSLVVKHLNTTLLSVMREAEELGFEGRYKRLKPVITQEFDLPFIARYTLGSSWDKLNEQQRTQFTETFQKLSITDYAHYFDSYSGQHFTIEGESPLPRSGIQVRSKLIDPDGSNVVFDYLLHKTDGQWRIVNVIANGVSDLAVKRAEYRQIMRKEGFNSLLNKLKKKIELHQR